jgi:hypothetical protein
LRHIPQGKGGLEVDSTSTVRGIPGVIKVAVYSSAEKGDIEDPELPIHLEIRRGGLREAGAIKSGRGDVIISRS